MSDWLKMGYQKVPTGDGVQKVDPCVPVQTLKRQKRVAPTDPTPNDGGFIPRNNIYERI